MNICHTKEGRGGDERERGGEEEGGKQKEAVFQQHTEEQVTHLGIPRALLLQIVLDWIRNHDLKHRLQTSSLLLSSAMHSPPNAFISSTCQYFHSWSLNTLFHCVGVPSSFFFFFGQYWDLNSGFYTCEAGTLSLESCLQPFVLCFFLETQSCFLPRLAWTMDLCFPL
jgi:hypothetical protein